jgi:hypothetical protein
VWREKANFRPTLTRRDPLLSANREGSGAIRQAPPWPPVCSVHGGRDLARRLMLVRGGSVRLGRARQDAGFFLDCAAARKRESGYAVCADALSAAILPWRASAVSWQEELSPG